MESVLHHLDLREPTCPLSRRASLGPACVRRTGRQKRGHLPRIQCPGQEREFPVQRKEFDQTLILRQERGRARGWRSCGASISSIVARVDLLKLVLFCEGHYHPLGLTLGWVSELDRVQDLALRPGLIHHLLESHRSNLPVGTHRGQHLAITELLHVAG